MDADVLKQRGGVAQRGGAVGVVHGWEARIRRALLIAHAAPAVFGLVAVSAGVSGREARVLDIAVWAFVLAWSGFLLVGGWGRAASGVALGRWVLADAVAMAGLMFVGTPARQVADYVAIDGALFASAFVSTRLGFLQLGVVFTGLAAAAAARAGGSSIPSPLVGWLLPVVVPAAGVVAFGYLRVGLMRLRSAMATREELVHREHRLWVEAAGKEAILRGVESIDERVAPAIAKLAALTETYATQSLGTPAAAEEVAWLWAAVDRARRDARELGAVLDEVDACSVEEAIDTGILGASALHVMALAVTKNLQGSDAIVTQPVAEAVTGFVREAVTNAVIHAHPPIEVTADIHDGALRVSVTDGGPRPTSKAPAVHGLGNEALDGYANSVGGRLEHTPHLDRHTLTLIVERVETT